ncbi:hypothetical protein [Pedococcus sp. P5_B7]
MLSTLDVGGPSAADDQAHALAQTRAELTATESDDAELQPVLARMAPTWTGTVEELLAAARGAVDL